MSAIHRIRRQRWQVRAASPADAFAIRSLLHRENEASLLPAIEAAFAECDAGQEIHLPRLEIKLSASSLDKLADELPSRLAEAVRAALGEAIQGLPVAQPVVKGQVSAAARLCRYLLTGQVDWFDADREAASLREQLAAEARRWSALPAANWSALLADLPSTARARSDAFFRLLQLLNDDDRRAWWDFATREASSLADNGSTVIALLREVYPGQAVDPALRLLVLALVLIAADTISTSPGRAGLRGMFEQLAGLLGPLSTVDRKNWQKIESLLGEKDPDKADNYPDVGQSQVGEKVSGTLCDEPAETFERSPYFPVDREQAPGLPVRSAGLVLLHPYLPRLFAALGWVAERHPAGETFPWAALPRAAALLNWLATGREEPLEFELGTVKLLLGLRPDDALPVADGLLGDAEREEGGALLAAVVEHWPALGQTSIDGLRVSFLQRGGLLYPVADGWLLRPQPETYDILLDRLPWGISILRLPWMTKSLHTEWTRV